MISADEYRRYLANAVARDIITEDEAVLLMIRFNAGDVDEIILPLPAEESQNGTDAERLLAALLFLLALLGRRRAPGMPPMSMDERARLRDEVRAQFEQRITALAVELANSGGVNGWHAGMNGTLREYLERMATAGRGRMLTAGEMAQLDDIIRTQEAFLSRFAGEISARAGTDNPFSEAYIRNRANQYAGEGWGEWFAQAESDGLERGWVVDYVSRDDPVTCSPCKQAQDDGPYLPGRGPMPGQVCLGAGNCRCERVPRFDPTAWAQLSGVTL